MPVLTSSSMAGHGSSQAARGAVPIAEMNEKKAATQRVLRAIRRREAALGLLQDLCERWEEGDLVARDMDDVQEELHSAVTSLKLASRDVLESIRVWEGVAPEGTKYQSARVEADPTNQPTFVYNGECYLGKMLTDTLFAEADPLAGLMALLPDGVAVFQSGSRPGSPPLLPPARRSVSRSPSPGALQVELAAVPTAARATTTAAAALPPPRVLSDAPPAAAPVGAEVPSSGDFTRSTVRGPSRLLDLLQDQVREQEAAAAAATTSRPSSTSPSALIDSAAKACEGYPYHRPARSAATPDQLSQVDDARAECVHSPATDITEVECASINLQMQSPTRDRDADVDVSPPRGAVRPASAPPGAHHHAADTTHAWGDGRGAMAATATGLRAAPPVVPNPAFRSIPREGSALQNATTVVGEGEDAPARAKHLNWGASDGRNEPVSEVKKYAAQREEEVKAKAHAVAAQPRIPRDKPVDPYLSENEIRDMTAMLEARKHRKELALLLSELEEGERPKGIELTPDDILKYNERRDRYYPTPCLAAAGEEAVYFWKLTCVDPEGFTSAERAAAGLTSENKLGAASNQTDPLLISSFLYMLGRPQYHADLLPGLPDVRLRTQIAALPEDQVLTLDADVVDVYLASAPPSAGHPEFPEGHAVATYGYGRTKLRCGALHAHQSEARVSVATAALPTRFFSELMQLVHDPQYATFFYYFRNVALARMNSAVSWDALLSKLVHRKNDLLGSIDRLKTMLARAKERASQEPPNIHTKPPRNVPALQAKLDSKQREVATCNTGIELLQNRSVNGRLRACARDVDTFLTTVRNTPSHYGFSNREHAAASLRMSLADVSTLMAVSIPGMLLCQPVTRELLTVPPTPLIFITGAYPTPDRDGMGMASRMLPTSLQESLQLLLRTCETRRCGHLVFTRFPGVAWLSDVLEAMHALRTEIRRTGDRLINAWCENFTIWVNPGDERYAVVKTMLADCTHQSDGIRVVLHLNSPLLVADTLARTGASCAVMVEGSAVSLALGIAGGHWEAAMSTNVDVEHQTVCCTTMLLAHRSLADGLYTDEGRYIGIYMAPNAAQRTSDGMRDTLRAPNDPEIIDTGARPVVAQLKDAIKAEEAALQHARDRAEGAERDHDGDAGGEGAAGGGAEGRPSLAELQRMHRPTPEEQRMVAAPPKQPLRGMEYCLEGGTGEDGLALAGKMAQKARHALEELLREEQDFLAVRTHELPGEEERVRLVVEREENAFRLKLEKIATQEQPEGVPPVRVEEDAGAAVPTPAPASPADESSFDFEPLFYELETLADNTRGRAEAKERAERSKMFRAKKMEERDIQARAVGARERERVARAYPAGPVPEPETAPTTAGVAAAATVAALHPAPGPAMDDDTPGGDNEVLEEMMVQQAKVMMDAEREAKQRVSRVVNLEDKEVVKREVCVDMEEERRAEMTQAYHTTTESLGIQDMEAQIRNHITHVAGALLLDSPDFQRQRIICNEIAKRCAHARAEKVFFRKLQEAFYRPMRLLTQVSCEYNTRLSIAQRELSERALIVHCSRTEKEDLAQLQAQFHAQLLAKMRVESRTPTPDVASGGGATGEHMQSSSSWGISGDQVVTLEEHLRNEELTRTALATEADTTFADMTATERGARPQEASPVRVSTERSSTCPSPPPSTRATDTADEFTRSVKDVVDVEDAARSVVTRLERAERLTLGLAFVSDTTRVHARLDIAAVVQGACGTLERAARQLSNAINDLQAAESNARHAVVLQQTGESTELWVERDAEQKAIRQKEVEVEAAQAKAEAEAAASVAQLLYDEVNARQVVSLESDAFFTDAEQELAQQLEVEVAAQAKAKAEAAAAAAAVASTAAGLEESTRSAVERHERAERVTMGLGFVAESRRVHARDEVACIVSESSKRAGDADSIVVLSDTEAQARRGITHAQSTAAVVLENDEYVERLVAQQRDTSPTKTKANDTVPEASTRASTCPSPPLTSRTAATSVDEATRFLNETVEVEEAARVVVLRLERAQRLTYGLAFVAETRWVEARGAVAAAREAVARAPEGEETADANRTVGGHAAGPNGRRLVRPMTAGVKRTATVAPAESTPQQQGWGSDDGRDDGDVEYIPIDSPTPERPPRPMTAGVKRTATVSPSKEPPQQQGWGSDDEEGAPVEYIPLDDDEDSPTGRDAAANAASAPAQQKLDILLMEELTIGEATHRGQIVNHEHVMREVMYLTPDEYPRKFTHYQGYCDYGDEEEGEPVQPMPSRSRATHPATRGSADGTSQPAQPRMFADESDAEVESATSLAGGGLSIAACPSEAREFPDEGMASPAGSPVPASPVPDRSESPPCALPYPGEEVVPVPSPAPAPPLDAQPEEKEGTPAAVPHGATTTTEEGSGEVLDETVARREAKVERELRTVLEEEEEEVHDAIAAAFAAEKPAAAPRASSPGPCLSLLLTAAPASARPGKGPALSLVMGAFGGGAPPAARAAAAAVAEPTGAPAPTTPEDGLALERGVTQELELAPTMEVAADAEGVGDGGREGEAPDTAPAAVLAEEPAPPQEAEAREAEVAAAAPPALAEVAEVEKPPVADAAAVPDADGGEESVSDKPEKSLGMALVEDLLGIDSSEEGSHSRGSADAEELGQVVALEVIDTAVVRVAEEQQRATILESASEYMFLTKLEQLRELRRLCNGFSGDAGNGEGVDDDDVGDFAREGCAALAHDIVTIGIKNAIFRHIEEDQSTLSNTPVRRVQQLKDCEELTTLAAEAIQRGWRGQGSRRSSLQSEDTDVEARDTSLNDLCEAALGKITALILRRVSQKRSANTRFQQEFYDELTALVEEELFGESLHSNDSAPNGHAAAAVAGEE